MLEGSEGRGQQNIVNNKRKGEWQKIRNGLKGMYNIMDYADAVNHVIQTTEQVKKAIRFYEGHEAMGSS